MVCPASCKDAALALVVRFHSPAPPMYATHVSDREQKPGKKIAVLVVAAAAAGVVLVIARKGQCDVADK